ncbi:MAG TPA: histone deacetylase [Pirellulales bacterium]|jgi:acetoin utilization deacetylase AcuC-like enzyme|nr:histone deacetylase [Pirellulales bacterium]
MTLLYSDPRFLEHATGDHPENPTRLAHILRHLDATGLADRCQRPAFGPVSPERLTRVHDSGYVADVAEFIARGGRLLEADTVVGPKSYDAALLAAGAVTDAVERVVRGEDTTALCLVRPPGHHARPNAAMGFCLFDNVAIGARLAIDELQLDRVLIVDWDVHHGNGTQEIFWRDAAVGFFSVHRWPFYPGSGASDETGSGPGLGTTLNLPLAFGTPRDDYIERFTGEVTRMADRLRPQLILLSAGFDSHRADPIGSLGLETEDFATLTAAVRDVAQAHAGGRIVSVLEGGYNPAVLAECVGLHLEGLTSPEIQNPKSRI